MALTHSRAIKAAKFAEDLADELKRVYWRTQEFLSHNNALSIAWAADPKPVYLNEDSNTNLDGVDFTRAQLSNMIGTLDQFRRLMENKSITQGDHLGNIEQLAKADA